MKYTDLTDEIVDEMVKQFQTNLQQNPPRPPPLAKKPSETSSRRVGIQRSDTTIRDITPSYISVVENLESPRAPSPTPSRFDMTFLPTKALLPLEFNLFLPAKLPEPKSL
ncbi:unnamed protein product [Caenorhabditis auriculariae]|uniref:Uncharacterized protein n=1 Tax=Caenorhabditis auriculariae TaxID=2777116 RepID=A0A8S1HXG9_9PELO|nr:unnamed protein product [Caenorhabditis auriculariae]